MQCDDGNVINGDGCSSTCTIETGYSCVGGGWNSLDVCTETCGDGLNLGFYACDDGNAVSGDGCSSTCYVELGWECHGGSSTTADVCTTECGNGMIQGPEVCDDYNTVSGDGCAKDCLSIEQGWACMNEPSFCYRIASPVINKTYVYTGRSKGLIGFEFNETVVMLPSWNPSDWNITVSGP